ncbi:MAG TPA: hypothetical protein VFR31_20655, partial [Thermoanaerobaculia bacterium]|nr:hypothetical protein [Thermoanaerobaculia bacterium]
MRRATVLGGLMLALSALAEAQTSNQQHPVQSFSTPGPKQVTLTVCNAGGCNSITKTVNVLDPMPSIVSALLGTVTVEAGQLVPLSGSGKGKPPLTYTWRVFQGVNLVRQVLGATGWLDTTGLAPGAYTVFMRISNGVGQVDSLPLLLTVLAPQGTEYFTVAPCRMLDTRIGPALQSGSTRLVNVDGACGVPPGAKALAVNVTAVSPTVTGNMVLFPGNYP